MRKKLLILKDQTPYGMIAMISSHLSSILDARRFYYKQIIDVFRTGSFFCVVSSPTHNWHVILDYSGTDTGTHLHTLQTLARNQLSLRDRDKSLFSIVPLAYRTHTTILCLRLLYAIHNYCSVCVCKIRRFVQRCAVPSKLPMPSLPVPPHI